MKSLCSDIFEEKISILHTIQSARPQLNGQMMPGIRVLSPVGILNFLVLPCNFGHLRPLSYTRRKSAMKQAFVCNQRNSVRLWALTLNTSYETESAYNVLGQTTLSHCTFNSNWPFYGEQIGIKHAVQTDTAISTYLLRSIIGNSTTFLRLHCPYHSQNKGLRSSYPELEHNIYTCILLIKQQNKYANSNHIVCGHKSKLGLCSRNLSAFFTRKPMAVTALNQHNNAKTYNLSNIDSVSETKLAFCSCGIVQKESIVFFSVQILKKEKDANAMRTIIHNGLDSMFFECRNTKLSCYLCTHVQHASRFETIVTLFNIPRTRNSIKNSKKSEVAANDNCSTSVDRTVVIQEKI